MRCTHPLLYVRDAHDACIVLEAVRSNILPLWTRRLNPSERDSIQPGNIYVWEEAEEKGGLERWTDGRRWTQSRMRLDFLFYEETIPLTEDEKMIKRRHDSPPVSRRQERPLKPGGLAKQTISMIVNTRSGPRRWHLVSYTSFRSRFKTARSNQRNFDRLEDRKYPIPLIDQYDYLRNIAVPNGTFLTTRGYSWNKRPHESLSSYDAESDDSSAPPTSPIQRPHPRRTESSPTTCGQQPPRVTSSLHSRMASPTPRNATPAQASSIPDLGKGFRRMTLNTRDLTPQHSAALGDSSKRYTPLTPEDRRALGSFPLRL